MVRPRLFAQQRKQVGAVRGVRSEASWLGVVARELGSQVCKVALEDIQGGFFGRGLGVARRLRRDG